MDNIVSYKLISGEEIIGKLVGEDSNSRTVTLTHTRLVVIQRNNKGQVVGVDYPAYSWVGGDGEIDISRFAIVGTPQSLEAELVDIYNQSTTTIQLVK